MDILYTSGIVLIEKLQHHFQNQNELMLFLSHTGDPRNAFLLYFPVVFCVHRSTGALVLWLACLSEWLNGILKWILHAERPYWWIRETDLYKGQTTPEIQQYRLTCETGPGSPSGHAMVTASVLLAVTLAVTKQTKLRPYQRGLCWSLYAVVMVSICVSRCYIATHFPHQVLLGAVTGVLLTMVFNRVKIERLTLPHYILVSGTLLLSSLLVYVAMEKSGVDPRWSIAMATKWCKEADWVHLDTTVFNVIMRDGGALLGYGVFLRLCEVGGKRSTKPTSSWITLLHIVVSLILCQVVEHLKPPQTSPGLYYLITYLKMGVLVTMVALVTMFPWRSRKDSMKVKQSKKGR